MSDLERAVAALGAGRPVVIPTDTVYGIAALPQVKDALEAVFRIKGRPQHKALPVLGAGLEQLSGVVVVDERLRALARRFWPGALTIVAARATGFVHSLGAGDPAASGVAVRVPNHGIALELLRRAGPVAVTSANLAGEAPATTVEEARRALGPSIDVYVDGGRRAGRVSTVISLLDDPAVLREGAIRGTEVLDVVRPAV